MKQTKIESILEQFLNIGSGLILSTFIFQPLIFNIFNYSPTVSENFQMAAVFTIFSILRGYIWRRIFNHRGHQTKSQSFFEQTLSVVTGVLLSLIIIQPIMFPYFNIHTNMYENFIMAILFTIISILRGYIWRRYFNHKLHLRIMS